MLVLCVSSLWASDARAYDKAVPPEIVERAEWLSLQDLKGTLNLRVEPLRQRIVVQAPQGDLAAAIQRFRLNDRSICPRVEFAGTEITFHCRNRRIRATLDRREKGRGLAVYQLMGLPWKGEDVAPPMVTFDPVAVGIGGPCPGTNPASEGECALRAGELAQARTHFQQALDGPAAPFAALRLGDLALLADDAGAALTYWKRARMEGRFSRLAVLRLCELDAVCLDTTEARFAFQWTDLPREIRDDAVLRAARLESFRGHVLAAARIAAYESVPRGACTTVPTYCRRLLLTALREDGDTGEQALQLYLSLPDRDQGPMSLELLLAAAERSAAIGAPMFGANILTMVMSKLRGEELGSLLLRSAELYSAGGDRAHAQVVLEFARVNLGPKLMRAPRWAALARRLSNPKPPRAPDLVTPLDHIEEELKLARETTAAAARLEPEPGGAP
jgi:tetratricopeptide (TPR) repeat protein